MENKILKKRWDGVDKKLSTFISQYEKENKKFRRSLQDVFDTINIKTEDIYNYADKDKVDRLKSKIKDFKEEYEPEGYILFQLNEYNKSKLRNCDIILCLILLEYFKQYYITKRLETELFRNIGSLAYMQGQEEVKRGRLTPLNIALITSILAMPTIKGYKYYAYKSGEVSYNAKQIYQKTLDYIRADKQINVKNKDIELILDKQSRRYIKKKDIEPKKEYQDLYSGYLDDEICFLVNQMALKGMVIQGCEKVRFIAVIDEETTEMCKTLDNQVFNIFDYNEFYRYSDEDKKSIHYKIKGLEVGVNMPPITNHYHHCRSTIFPVR